MTTFGDLFARQFSHARQESGQHGFAGQVRNRADESAAVASLPTNGETVMNASLQSAWCDLLKRWLNTHATTVCSNIEAEGVIIDTVTVQVTSNTACN